MPARRPGRGRKSRTNFQVRSQVEQHIQRTNSEVRSTPPRRMPFFAGSHTLPPWQAIWRDEGTHALASAATTRGRVGRQEWTRAGERRARRGLFRATRGRESRIAEKKRSSGNDECRKTNDGLDIKCLPLGRSPLPSASSSCPLPVRHLTSRALCRQTPPLPPTFPFS